MPHAGHHAARVTANTAADLVIVGASLGGLRTAEAARKAGFEGSILIIGDEPHPPYNRPPLSKSALMHGESAESLAFPIRDSLGSVQWMLTSRASSADLDRSRVRLSCGEEISYTHLVIATGRRPRRLPFEAERSRRHVVYTISDAERLRASTEQGERVVIIGGGFIGCETAASLTQRGCSVTLVCTGELPLLRPLGRELAQSLSDRHRDEGVRIVTGASVVGLGTGSTSTHVQLSDGRWLEADVVVEAVGSVPAVEWLANNDLVITDGVETDNRLRARRSSGGMWKSVSVVGDVARFPHPLAPDSRVAIPHWSTPGDTARTVGSTIAATHLGSDPLSVAPFTAQPSFWSDQYDLHILSYGLPALCDSIKVLEGHVGSDCIVGYFRDGQLVGLVGIGMRVALMSMRNSVGASIR